MCYNWAMTKFTLPFIFAIFLASALSASERFVFEEPHIGTLVRIILYAPSQDVAERAAGEAFDSFRRVNSIMNTYDRDSELSQLCATRGWIRVSDDLFTVLQAARHYNAISDGAFDVTVGPMVRLWRRSFRQRELPTERRIEEAKQLVGNHLWEMDKCTKSVRLLKEGMVFDLSAIAKGYAVDRAFEIIQRHGITSVLVDAGGDFSIGAAPPNTEGWRIAKNDETVLMQNTAMATSGGQFQYVDIDGVRYLHIVDPKTGLGMTSAKTVHIIAPTAMEADALATAVFVLGRERGKALIATLPKVSVEMVEPECKADDLDLLF